ncbi:hypothetical protein HZH68_012192 [Vespula germanica]|uniref:Uncharacterized protein n=1 Tax=Vespula germanica TaxID=30212 RepID=A0A834MXL0_VESGE|nr:hypothetical protein HZH68_012192 [Vespula germanica]
MTDVQTNSTKEDAASKRLQQDDSTFRTEPVRVQSLQNNGSFGPFDVQEERTEAGILMNFVKTSDVLSGFVSLDANNLWAKYKILDRIALDDITYDKLMKCDPFSFPAPFALATMPNVGPNEMTLPRY